MYRRRSWHLLSVFCATVTSSTAFASDVPPPTASASEIDASSRTTPLNAQPESEPAPLPGVVSAPTTQPVATPAPSQVTASAPVVQAKPAPTAFRVEGPKDSFLRIGLLLQPQLQVAGDLARDGYARNLYIRRTRILLGGTLFGQFEYFVETDYPNLFFANNVTGTGGAADTAVKSTPGMNIQDAFATWKAYGDYVKFDMGYMLPSLAHNALQGATTLLSLDYFAYSFVQGNSFQSSANPTGRDLGVQLRGLLLGGHLEYRAGLFQGLRKGQTTTEVGSQNFFRFAARVQVNLLDAETGMFYAGTYHGTKKVLSVGGSVDLQDSYKYFAGDAFADLPVGPLGVVTAQVNVTRLEGGDFLPVLVKRTAVMGEAGFLFSDLHLSPVVRAEHRWGSGTLADQTYLGGGLAYWPYGHNVNVKAFYTRLQEKGAAHAANQFNIQWQLYMF